MPKLNPFVACALALALSAFAGSARADGVVVAKSAVDASARQSLQAAINKAKSAQPAAFDAVRKVNGYTHAGAKRMRHNKPSATRELRQLGRAALYPLIELVAFKAERSSLADDEWQALGDGALQALSFLREPKASPVLAAAFLSAPSSTWVEHAAEGLGMLCGDAERNLLLSNLDAASPRRAAAVVGLGYCHRSDVAEQLALQLDDPSPEIATRAARALGYVGSSWALGADKNVAPDEAEKIRAFASGVLIGAYAKHDKPVRDVIYRAVLMVEHSSAAGAIEAAKAHASGEIRGELERLAHRLELNRARARP